MMNKINGGRKVEDIEAASEGEPSALQVLFTNLRGLIGGHPVVAPAQLFVLEVLGVDPADEEPGPRLGSLFLLPLLDSV